MSERKFSRFKEAVEEQFELMRGHQLYRTEVEKDLLWLTYIESFPEGSNPVYKERTEHDCQACKSFIRAAGSMVAVIDGALVSLWDCRVGEPYAVVAKELSKLVKSAPIKNVFLHDLSSVGVDKNYQEGLGSEILTWEHFHIKLPSSCVHHSDRGSVYSEKRSTMEVYKRGLEEITLDAIETTIDLIQQGSLYRGEEHLSIVKGFLERKKKWDKLDGSPPTPLSVKKDIFCWAQDAPLIARIRNTAIGTLLVDLSEGKDLDDAVRMFESKVAPQNYKRPKALVTKAMIERARKKVEELGYGASLGRRFAVVEDIRVNNVLFANRDARLAMNADVFDELVSQTRDNPKNLEKVEKVPIEKFIKDILPKVNSIELLLENRHAGNLVNLVAPTDPEAPSILKWDNNFTWSYQGDLADSIKERVKARGGSVTGDFRASLAWFNSDDLDLHLVEPSATRRAFGLTRGEHICYSHRRSFSGGVLDVDMNVQASGPHFSRNAVENITYQSRKTMLEGTYRLFVNQFRHREHEDVGFEVELEFGGELMTFAYDKEVRPREDVTVAEFTYSHKEGLKIIKSLPRQGVVRTLWNLQTQSFHPVTIAMLSPNHWNGRPVGNKHYFFMLQGCQRDGSSRGFFNEQLSDELREHRKVFEIIGARMRTEEGGPQLSGLGFSSTQRNNVYAKLSGSFNRTINIMF